MPQGRTNSSTAHPGRAISDIELSLVIFNLHTYAFKRKTSLALSTASSVEQGGAELEGFEAVLWLKMPKKARLGRRTKSHRNLAGPS
mmetsp:Transcript_11136/g.20584  ORF Transcript_11136/g.20584 Transcript_11136/m.20584 type:complete len:87 (+) Transcript_11136:69-329(+)